MKDNISFILIMITTNKNNKKGAYEFRMKMMPHFSSYQNKINK